MSIKGTSQFSLKFTKFSSSRSEVEREQKEFNESENCAVKVHIVNDLWKLNFRVIKIYGLQHETWFLTSSSLQLKIDRVHHIINYES